MHDKDWIVRGHNNKGPVSQILKASPFDISLWRLCKITKVWDDQHLQLEPIFTVAVVQILQFKARMDTWAPLTGNHFAANRKKLLAVTPTRVRGHAR